MINLNVYLSLSIVMVVSRKRTRKKHAGRARLLLHSGLITQITSENDMWMLVEDMYILERYIICDTYDIENNEHKCLR